MTAHCLSNLNTCAYQGYRSLVGNCPPSFWSTITVENHIFVSRRFPVYVLPTQYVIASYAPDTQLYFTFRTKYELSLQDLHNSSQFPWSIISYLLKIIVIDIFICPRQLIDLDVSNFEFWISNCCCQNKYSKFCFKSKSMSCQSH